MSHNTFGHLFRVTTWGESHGPAIGCVVDGCPPLIPLTEADLQPWLDQRKPGGSRFVTQRKESDTARILSGVFDDGEGPVTTGTPISILIENEDQRSKDYGEIARAYRPGHADFTYQAKYGVRDHRGGGRSSARETASRVAAGAVARKVLGESVRIAPAWSRSARTGSRRKTSISTPFTAIRCSPPRPRSWADWEAYLDGVRKSGSSIGAVVALEVTGVPAGWGAPLYGKLDANWPPP
jgi:chorismate synthase